MTLFDSAKFSNLLDLIQISNQNYQNSKAFNLYQGQKWLSFSNAEFSDNIYSLTLALKSLGLKSKDGFAIVAKPSPIWLMIDFSIIANRAVSVPIFPDISRENLLFEIDNAEVKFIFCDCIENIKIIKNSGAKFKKIISYGFECKDDDVVKFDDLLKNGQEIYRQNPNLFINLANEISPDDIATVIYTSGSTGMPKGVEITHKNLVSQILAANQVFALDKTDVALSFLPLAHIFERMIVSFYIFKGVSIYFSDDIKNVGKLFHEVKPNLVTVVPRMLEKVLNKMKAGLEESNLSKKLIGKLAFFLAKNFFYQKDKFSFARNKLYWLFDVLVYKKLRSALGGNLRMMICGGAPLSLEVEKFFCGIGVNLYVGYGITEASPVIAANYPNCQKIATVGKKFPDIEVKIDNQGELWAKGKNIMKAYHKDPERTAQTLFDGWLKTGDLASIDNEGFIKIIGRKKDLFKTANGKYVSPIIIEQKLLNKSQLLTAACVIAEGRRFVSCLLFVDFEILPKYKKKLALENLSDEEFLNNVLVKNYIANLIAQTNQTLNHWEQIQKYYLTKQPIAIKSGELTPSMKLRRGFVEEKFKDIIDQFYKE